MSQHGPIVVIANERDGTLARALDSAGLSPIIDALWARAPGVVERAVPSAVIMTEAASAADQRMMEKIAQAITSSPLYTPVLARIGIGVLEGMPGALPLAADASSERIVARLRAALRVRALHISVTDQARLLTGADPAPPDLQEGDPLEDATVLVTGRGRSYPGLTMAVGERVGAIPRPPRSAAAGAAACDRYFAAGQSRAPCRESPRGGGGSPPAGPPARLGSAPATPARLDQG